MKKVFISYSHKDEPWKDRLKGHLKAVEKVANISAWDDRKIEAGEEWFKKIETALKEAHIAVLLISADFLGSEFINDHEIPVLKERHEHEGVRIIPLIIRPCAWEEDLWLSSFQGRPNDGKPLSGMSDFEIETFLTELAKEICTIVKSWGVVPGQEKRTFIPPEPENISLYRMPVTDAKIFGRERETAMLDEAWNSGQTNIVTLIAWGGVGKTALVNHWINGMTTEGFRGAEKVYAWSFYSQGAAEGKQASADQFMQETLRWFGDADPTAGAPEDKGRRLAGLIRKSKTLLILDGMEPLQYPPSKDGSMTGQLKDRGLRTLLKELAVSQPGLCIVTSREGVSDLSVYAEPAVKAVTLEHLSVDAGTALLKHLGVHGRDVAMTEAVKEYGGHALALRLLGNYLSMGYDGDIRKRDTIRELIEEPGTGGHAKRMMQAYRHWLGESAELDILYMMGLFDRPVEEGAIEALKEAPEIVDVTERLVGISRMKWNYAVKRLRELGLLAKEEGRKSGGLDCHPLVREYFGERLKEENAEGWREAHSRLYKYYKELPEKGLPDTLEEMGPLFSAVAHGCLAGRHQEAMDEVYYIRIKRKDKAFINHKLCAFGADLSALSHFFDEPWERPASGLRESTKASVLNWSAFGLRAVGRLREAVQPMKVSLRMYVKQEFWIAAAIAANNLSELLLTLGDVSGAVAAGRESVAHADRSGEWDQRMKRRTTLADALHQSGGWDEAEGLFREAEEIQREYQPEFHVLYSLPGFRFCDLLLERGKDREVIERAENLLEWEIEGWVLDIALDHLTLGRAWMERGRKKAKDYLDRAVTGLRESGYQYYLPLGLLARAAFYRFRGEFDTAWIDLSEAQEIAEAGDMKLHLCDFHLEATRLCTAEGKESEAKEHDAKAEELIEETEYFRRKKELKSKN